MIFEYLFDFIFNLIYRLIDLWSSSLDVYLVIPDSIYDFISITFSYLSFFVPLTSLYPLLIYHGYILTLRLIVMVLGLLKRIPFV